MEQMWWTEEVRVVQEYVKAGSGRERQCLWWCGGEGASKSE